MDDLRGLKENVLLGHLIPAGTGFRSYVDMQVEHLAEPPVTEEDDLATLQAAAAQAAEARGAQPPSVVIPEVETAAPEPAPAGSTDG